MKAFDTSTTTYNVGVLRCQANGKVMVICSKYDMAQRISQELQRSLERTKYGGLSPFRAALREHGREQFEIIEHYTVLDKEAGLRFKRLLVDSYDSTNPAKGYNEVSFSIADLILRRPLSLMKD